MYTSLHIVTREKVTDAVIVYISLHASGHAKASLFKKSVKNCNLESVVHRDACNPKLSCTAVVLKGVNSKIPAIPSREMTATARCKWTGAAHSVCTCVCGYIRYIR